MNKGGISLVLIAVRLSVTSVSYFHTGNKVKISFFGGGILLNENLPSILIIGTEM